MANATAAIPQGMAVPETALATQITVDRAALAPSVDSLLAGFARLGKPYTRSQVERALWHWLAESIDELIEDADFHVNGLGACFNPTVFAAALHEFAEQEGTTR